MKNSFLMSLFGLLFSIVLHYERTLDWALQNYFLRANLWLVDENEPIGKFIFYNGPKYLLVAFALSLLLLALNSIYRGQSLHINVFYVLICLSVIPLLIDFGKQITNEACPKDLAAFGGTIQLDRMSGECFPGGHASGGFALLSLYWFFNQRKLALIPGLLFGTILGVYQMLKGAHFVSDTLCTAFFAWFFCEGAWRLYQKLVNHEFFRSKRIQRKRRIL